MGYVIEFKNLKPAGRTDNRKWVTVGVYEAPNVSGVPGVWTEIDSQALADYADPTNPPVFAVTTVNATVPSGLWYKVQFRDAFTGLQDSVPEYNGTSGVPEVEWVRETSNTDFDELGYPAPDPGAIDRLQSVLDESVVQFYGATGINPATVSETDKRLQLIRMALRMYVEYECASKQMEQLETASDFILLSSMSVSDYSETRRGLTRMNPQILHPWPELNRLLGFIVNFDTQGGALDEAPGITSPNAFPAPYERLMIEYGRRYQHGRGGGVTGPLWPQPWVTNRNGTP